MFSSTYYRPICSVYIYDMKQVANDFGSTVSYSFNRAYLLRLFNMDYRCSVWNVIWKSLCYSCYTHSESLLSFLYKFFWPYKHFTIHLFLVYFSFAVSCVYILVQWFNFILVYVGLKYNFISLIFLCLFLIHIWVID